MTTLNIDTLTIISCEQALEYDGHLYLSAKSIEGMILYAKLWPGKVRLLLQKSSSNKRGINDKVLDNDMLPFDYSIVSFTDDDLKNHYLNSSVVLTTLEDYRQESIILNCHNAGIPCVSIAEISFLTSVQIINSGTRNIILRLRRILWAWNRARKNKKSITLCAGVQFNGMPTYQNYKNITKNSLLFFDNRTKNKDYISVDSLKKRLQHLKSGNPIRLAFSGRLTEIKGTDHLIKIANILKDRNLNFNLKIYGDGNLAAPMEEEIKQQNLEEYVKMMGSIDFETELLPALKKEVDLFICCHKQGDPSCTYIETMSCGIPILGYNNEAFEGLLSQGNIGWTTNLNDFEEMAKKIIELDKNRDEIATKSMTALEFSSKHTFEKTFKNRIDHLLKIVRNKTDE